MLLAQNFGRIETRGWTTRPVYCWSLGENLGDRKAMKFIKGLRKRESGLYLIMENNPLAKVISIQNIFSKAF